LSASKFFQKFFIRDTIDALSWTLWNTDMPYADVKITFVTPEKFISEYLNGASKDEFSRKRYVLESDRPIAAKFMAYLEELDCLKFPDIEIYRAGKLRRDYRVNVVNALDKIRDKIERKAEKLLYRMSMNMKKELKGMMSDWKFWYAEIEDRNEPAGWKSIKKLKWGRVFNNH